MRKSNTTAFKAEVKKYYDSIVQTQEEQEELSEAFWSYYGSHKKLQSNYALSFENFVNACATNFDFETFRQRELLAKWYGETEEQQERYAGEEVSRFFYYHIYREFEKRNTGSYAF